MADCIFCQIVKGDIPSNRVYEDKEFLAFLDINPVNKGHVLIVPKRHYENSLETPEELLGGIVALAKKIGLALKKAVGAQGVNFGVNNGAAAGQVIFHTHWHVIPRFESDKLSLWPAKEYESDEERAEVAAKITREV